MSETSGMSDEEIQEQIEALQRERQRRDEAVAKEQEKAALAGQINALLLRYRLLSADGDSTEWVQPVAAVDAYPRGAVVTHDGQEWESTVVANVWEPGVSGWRLTPEKDETGTEIPPEFLQPTGAHDAYLTGDRITWEDGHVYVAARDGVVHKPEEHPDSWVRVGSDPDDDGEGAPEETDEDGEGDPTVPEWVQPTGGHDAYQSGEQVTYDGMVYESTVDNNVWSPADYPQGWQKVEESND